MLGMSGCGLVTPICKRPHFASWKEAEKVVRLQLARMNPLRGEWPTSEERELAVTQMSTVPKQTFHHFGKR